jgi:MFS family permease
MLGVAIGAGAVGGLLGAFLTARLVRGLGVGPTLILGMVGFPAPLVLIPLAGGPDPLLLGAFFTAEFLSGFGLMLLDISSGSLQAALIPDSVRSRVSGAFRTVNYGMRPLGALAAGALGSTIGLRPTLWIATVGGALGVLWVLPSPIRRIHELPPKAVDQPEQVRPSPPAGAPDPAARPARSPG